ncbi:MAG: hypothetical protein JXJ20_02745 [Anaerolineae bacterium]|nr:hypothetical protein [Anaerolineae bacterium]
MWRTRIDYLIEEDRFTLSYRLPARLASLEAALWSIIGGLAVGAGLATALIAAGIITGASANWLLFRVLPAAGTVSSALLIYWFAYLRPVCNCCLRVAFDFSEQTVTPHLDNGRDSLPSLAFQDVAHFRIADHCNGPDINAALVMDTTAGPIVLLTADRDHLDEYEELPRLITLLNQRLGDAHARLEPDAAH